MSKSKTLVRHATQDGAVGLILGLLVATGLVSADFDIQQGLIASQAPLAALSLTVAAITAQCALVALIGGLVIRKFSQT